MWGFLFVLLTLPQLSHANARDDLRSRLEKNIRRQFRQHPHDNPQVSLQPNSLVIQYSNKKIQHFPVDSFADRETSLTLPGTSASMSHTANGKIYALYTTPPEYPGAMSRYHLGIFSPVANPEGKAVQIGILPLPEDTEPPGTQPQYQSYPMHETSFALSPNGKFLFFGITVYSELGDSYFILIYRTDTDQLWSYIPLSFHAAWFSFTSDSSSLSVVGGFADPPPQYEWQMTKPVNVLQFPLNKMIGNSVFPWFQILPISFSSIYYPSDVASNAGQTVWSKFMYSPGSSVVGFDFLAGPEISLENKILLPSFPSVDTYDVAL